jgi:hypothetical protein
VARTFTGTGTGSVLGPVPLTVTLTTAATTVSATIGGSALTLSRTLAAEIKRHKLKSLTVVVRVIDVNGTTTGFVSKLKAK